MAGAAGGDDYKFKLDTHEKTLLFNLDQIEQQRQHDDKYRTLVLLKEKGKELDKKKNRKCKYQYQLLVEAELTPLFLKIVCFDCCT